MGKVFDIYCVQYKNSIRVSIIKNKNKELLFFNFYFFATNNQYVVTHFIH